MRLISHCFGECTILGAPIWCAYLCPFGQVFMIRSSLFQGLMIQHIMRELRRRLRIIHALNSYNNFNKHLKTSRVKLWLLTQNNLMI